MSIVNRGDTMKRKMIILATTLILLTGCSATYYLYLDTEFEISEYSMIKIVRRKSHE